jgi:hypothetical protein
MPELSICCAYCGVDSEFSALSAQICPARRDLDAQLNSHPLLDLPPAVTLKRVANLWTEFATHDGEALTANGERTAKKPNNLVVAATFEMAKT